MGLKSKKNKKKVTDKSTTEIDASVPDDNDYPQDDLESSATNITPSKVASKRKSSFTEDHEEESPRKMKKKKKKETVAPDSTGKKGKKSIRQMKKEKFAQRQAEAEAAAKDQLKSQCTSYLSQWKHDRQNWKFMKAKQVWLYKNKFSAKLVPETSWPIFLEYFESAKGNIRNMLIEDANKVIKQMDEWTESQEQEADNDENEEDTGKVQKPDDTVYNRARSLIQCLGE